MMLRILLVSIAGAMLVGCGSVPRYPNDQAKNVTVNLELGDTGFLTSVEVGAGINDLDADCQPHYRGNVELSPGVNKIGLAPGVLTYLMIDVVTTTPSRSGRFSQGTILKPAKGKQYEVDVSYVDDLYDFRLYEVRGSERRRIKVKPYTECTSRT